MAALHAAFDDAHTKVMGEAYDSVVGKLHGTGYPAAVREAIAGRVIEISGGSPERDAERLANAVLASLGIKL
jgi:hypothetical protein